MEPSKLIASQPSETTSCQVHLKKLEAGIVKLCASWIETCFFFKSEIQPTVEKSGHQGSATGTVNGREPRTGKRMCFFIF